MFYATTTGSRKAEPGGTAMDIGVYITWGLFVGLCLEKDEVWDSW